MVDRKWRPIAALMSVERIADCTCGGRTYEERSRQSETEQLHVAEVALPKTGQCRTSQFSELRLFGGPRTRNFQNSEFRVL
eukprot:5791604-Alexandrium_andersonii.AAC.1